ncbi:MAG: phage tail protein [Bermanella sp.]
MAAITTAGENLIASLQSQGQPLVIDKFILANISGLDTGASVDRSQGKPSVGQIVSEEDITQAGMVSSNTIVYSQVLGSDIGTWSFNWLGLYCSEHDTVIAIAYEPLQEKRATVGEVIGNVLTKNFAVEFSGASDLTGVYINAESWQIDFSARLLGMDEIQREIMHKVYGGVTTLDDSFNLYHDNGQYFISKGQGIVKGLFVELEEDLEIFPTAFPTFVHVDVWQEKSMAGIANKVNFVPLTSQTQPDYMNGPTQVYRQHLSEVLLAGVVGSQYKTETTSFKLYHQGNMPEAGTSQKGLVKFGADDSTSEFEAVSAKTFSEHGHALPEHSHDLPSHNHEISEVNGLQDALDSAAAGGGADLSKLEIVWSGETDSVNITGWGIGLYVVVFVNSTIRVSTSFYLYQPTITPTYAQGGSRNYQVTSVGGYFSVIDEQAVAKTIVLVLKVG